MEYSSAWFDQRESFHAVERTAAPLPAYGQAHLTADSAWDLTPAGDALSAWFAEHAGCGRNKRRGEWTIFPGTAGHAAITYRRTSCTRPTHAEKHTEEPQAGRAEERQRCNATAASHGR